MSHEIDNIAIPSNIINEKHTNLQSSSMLSLSLCCCNKYATCNMCSSNYSNENNTCCSILWCCISFCINCDCASVF